MCKKKKELKKLKKITDKHSTKPTRKMMINRYLNHNDLNALLSRSINT